MTAKTMSDRAGRLFSTLVRAEQRRTEGTPEEEEAKAECLRIRHRLEETFGHVEHEILADEIEALLVPIAKAEAHKQ